MEIYVIVVTKGRAPEVCVLLTWLLEQTVKPTTTLVVGTSEADVRGVASHPYAAQLPLEVLQSRTQGVCAQRNTALEHLMEQRRRTGANAEFVVVFFDDDFRPAQDWLEQCRSAFVRHPDVAALTGQVLADGVRGAGLSDDDARAFIDQQRVPQRHFASGPGEREVSSVYGCNMAFRDQVVMNCRFDERLALYGWQEDQDYTSQALAFGRAIYRDTCRGVHLGSKSGRVSGLRFGYSQIANPLYLVRKGTMSMVKGTRFVLRHLVSNGARSFRTHPRVDYAGRLRGNLLALRDTLRGRCHPLRVLELQ